MIPKYTRPSYVKADTAPVRDSAFLYEAAFISAQDVNPFSLNSTFNLICAPIAISSREKPSSNPLSLLCGGGQCNRMLLGRDLNGFIHEYDGLRARNTGGQGRRFPELHNNQRAMS